MRAIIRVVVFVGAVLLPLVPSLAEPAPAPVGAYAIHEVRLGEFDAAPAPVVSVDGLHIAYITHRGEKVCVVAGGKAGAAYDYIPDSMLILSPDGQHFACFAHRDDKWFAVVDGAEYEASGPPSFSPDSRRVQFASIDKPLKFREVVDGIAHDEPNPKFYSPDCKRVAYKVRVDNGKQHWAVVDGQRGTEYGNMWGLAFSPDGRHVGYMAYRNDKRFLVIDGIERDGEGRANLTFSPDGNHIAYMIHIGNKNCIVLDEQAGPAFDLVGLTLSFSPDSRRLAYVGIKGGKQCVVVDNQPGAEYDGIMGHRVTFSPDSKHVAYVAGKAGKAHIVVDGQAGAEYDGTGNPVFEPDGVLECLAYKGGSLFRVQYSPVPSGQSK